MTVSEIIQHTEEEMYNELKKLPDFERLPLPESWYKKFNIPKPTIPTLKQALKLHYETQIAFVNAMSDEWEAEVRPPAEGGVRPIPEAEPVEIKVIPGKTLKDIDLSGNLIENETPETQESE